MISVYDHVKGRLTMLKGELERQAAGGNPPLTAEAVDAAIERAKKRRRAPARDAGFDESKHKRADNGQFGAGGVPSKGSPTKAITGHERPNATESRKDPPKPRSKEEQAAAHKALLERVDKHIAAAKAARPDAEVKNHANAHGYGVEKIKGSTNNAHHVKTDHGTVVASIREGSASEGETKYVLHHKASGRTYHKESLSEAMATIKTLHKQFPTT